MKKFHFKQYVSRRCPGTSMVTIQNDGRFRFNAAAIEVFGLRDYLWVMLEYDIKQGAVAMQFSRTPSEGAIAVPQGSGEVSLGTKGLMRLMRVDYHHTRADVGRWRFPLKQLADTPGGFYIEGLPCNPNTD